MTAFRDRLEQRQIAIYFAAVLLAVLAGLMFPGTTALEVVVNPALALMLFVTFLQVPIAELGKALMRFRFLAALLVTNFLVMPLFVALLVQLLPDDPILWLGVLLVLLTPCIDYVVTFSHLGRADSRLLLAATPALLVVQMVLLPVYLQLFLGAEAVNLVRTGPFLQAFLWLIVVPLLLAALVQLWARCGRSGERLAATLGLLPVPATALVLFLVVAAVIPQLNSAMDAVLRVAPIYVLYAIVAPLIGWGAARMFRLDAAASRAILFSAATRNSLVVLPLAFTVPGAVPVLPAIIVAQTLIELVSELIYVRFVPKLGASSPSSTSLGR